MGLPVESRRDLSRDPQRVLSRTPLGIPAGHPWELPGWPCGALSRNPHWVATGIPSMVLLGIPAGCPWGLSVGFPVDSRLMSHVGVPSTGVSAGIPAESPWRLPPGSHWVSCWVPSRAPLEFPVRGLSWVLSWVPSRILLETPIGCLWEFPAGPHCESPWGTHGDSRQDPAGFHRSVSLLGSQ